jgi:hypothetical protein
MMPGFVHTVVTRCLFFFNAASVAKTYPQMRVFAQYVVARRQRCLSMLIVLRVEQKISQNPCIAISVAEK